jgi:hypothetical protein
LSRLLPAAIVRAVRFSRLLTLCAFLFLLCGCQVSPWGSSESYTKLRVTDYRGRLIAEWVAVGAVHPVDGGYRIRAVERLSGPPYMVLSKFPDTWKTTVAGPNIARWRCGKPLWLYQMDVHELDYK